MTQSHTPEQMMDNTEKGIALCNTAQKLRDQMKQARDFLKCAKVYVKDCEIASKVFFSSNFGEWHSEHGTLYPTQSDKDFAEKVYQQSRGF